MMIAAHLGLHVAAGAFLAVGILLQVWRDGPLGGAWAGSCFPCAAYPVVFIGYFSTYCLLYERWSTPRWRTLDWWLAAVGCVEVTAAICLFTRYQMNVWANV